MKIGFVYIWFDRKHRRYYIGSHWGSESDRYICSSRWMRNAYRRRPNDFKRRIVAHVESGRGDLLAEEHRWLQMIPQAELGKKYYNLTNHLNGHWTTDNEKRMTVGQKISASPNRSANISKAMKGKKPSELNVERRMAVMKGRKQSDEEKRKRSESLKGHKHSEQTKDKMRKPKPKVTCPHCSKTGGVSTMTRWHLSNCKYK